MSQIVWSQHTKMSPQIRLKIYVRCESPYVESSIINLFMTQFVDCCYELVFPTWGGDRKQLDKNRLAEMNYHHLDPHIKQFELEVQKIINLKSLVKRNG